MVFDGLHSFNAHVTQTKEKVSKRNNVLKALAGTSWGKDEELLLNSYKATGRAIVNYAAPVWTPSLAETHWSRLQTSQNAALRTKSDSANTTIYTQNAK